ncbi:hypothetical protein [Vulcanisaeta sp. JCM 16159]|nr:hypothetical protein [Vulcanisaeta sp. JCM 16159]
MVSARDGDDDITTHQRARPVGLLHSPSAPWQVHSPLGTALSVREID